MIGELLDWHVLLPWALGMVFGVFVGSTPGLTATMAVALIVPISYKLEPAAGLAMIIGVSFTAIFAGDIPATYLRIPGTPASAAATLDSHALAKRGKARLALLLDLTCSALGGLIGVVLLILVAPQLARLALRFTHYEYFWLGVVGLTMAALVTPGRLRHGLLAATLGLLLSTVGMDQTSGVPRLTFGTPELMEGIELIPVMIGLFGLAEVFRGAGRQAALAQPALTAEHPASWRELTIVVWAHKLTILVSSLLGTLIGALPGAGADIAAWGAYGVAQRLSPRGEQFGQGELEGVVAPTSANNAAVAGAWIPALVFGVPGDAVTAIVLGALMVYDIKPGPQVLEKSGDQVRQLFAIAIATQFLLIPAGLAGIRLFRLLLRLPRSQVLTGVTLFSLVGAFALRNSLLDVVVALVAGLAGWFLESRRIPAAPLVLGMVLGPMIEKNLRTGLIASHGSWLPFVTRPLSVAIFASLLLGWLVTVALRIRSGPPGPAAGPPRS